METPANVHLLLLCLHVRDPQTLGSGLLRELTRFVASIRSIANYRNLTTLLALPLRSESTRETMA